MLCVTQEMNRMLRLAMPKHPCRKGQRYDDIRQRDSDNSE